MNEQIREMIEAVEKEADECAKAALYLYGLKKESQQERAHDFQHRSDLLNQAAEILRGLYNA